MAGSKSNDYAIRILNLLRGTGISAFTGYAALYTSAASDTAPGTEVAGGSYARVAISFDFIDTTTIGNDGPVDFPTPTTDWGNIVGWGLHDSITGGNYIIFGEQSPAKNILAGDPVRYEMHTLTYSED